MGLEYKIAWKRDDARGIEAELAPCLRAMPGLVAVPDPSGAAAASYEYRAAPGSSMPDAYLQRSEEGLYFCASSAEGQRYLGVVVSRLTSSFAEVTVSEL